MSAMSAEELILIMKMSANTGSNRFLPYVSMTSAVNQATLMRFG